MYHKVRKEKNQNEKIKKLEISSSKYIDIKEHRVSSSVVMVVEFHCEAGEFQ